MDDTCEDLFRYSIDDSSGVLRFTEFKLCSRLENSSTGSVLAEYFVGRALCDVQPEDVTTLPECSQCECLDEILEHVLELQKQVGNCPTDKPKA